MPPDNEFINGVIAQKLRSLDQILSELKSLGQVSAGHLDEDWRTRRAVERDLQVLVEIVHRAVLFDQRPSLDERVELLMGLQKALGIDEIDLVVLNEASPITRFEAVSGRLLFSRHTGRQAEFISLTAREYEYAMALYQWGLANRPGVTGDARP